MSHCENKPKHPRIWLQGACSCEWSAGTEATWADHAVNDDDIEYVLASDLAMAVEGIKVLHNTTHVEGGGCMTCQLLERLKQ